MTEQVIDQNQGEATSPTSEPSKTLSSKPANKGFFISQVFKQAWKVFKQKWSTILLLFAVMIGVSFLYGLVAGDRPSLLFSLLSVFGQMLLGMVFLQVFVRLYREEEVSFDLVGQLLPRFGHYFIGTLFYALIVLGGLVLLIIPGLYWAIKYALVPFLIVDQKLKFTEAFKESARLTKGAKWDMIGFYFAAAVLAYSGFLALLVGVFVTAPVAYLAFAGLYVKLVERGEQSN
ncbi:MAG: hypothetical protein GF381_01225 [Candidatus Pacebacteria bacterium]|nr:hypothetical protein [Candidatus Paceibacterota bacterium]